MSLLLYNNDELKKIFNNLTLSLYKIYTDFFYEHKKNYDCNLILIAHIDDIKRRIAFNNTQKKFPFTLVRKKENPITINTEYKSSGNSTAYKVKYNESEVSSNFDKFTHKYLKYKQKYIKLKNNNNNI